MHKENSKVKFFSNVTSFDLKYYNCNSYSGFRNFKVILSDSPIAAYLS